jgi:protein-S-isoprenylcysteine O-methyltransferase Ste14/chorismate mutase
MLDAAGRLLFRRRNLIFPLAFAGLLLAFPPRPAVGWATWAGLLLVAAGQALRVVTIGLPYIKRGGKKGRFFAHGLVTDGMFAHCRNPLYAGNVAIVVGFLLVAGQGAAVLVGAVLFAAAYALIVRGEERYLAERFGEGYRDYCARVPRWWPRLRGLAATWRSHRFDGRRVVAKEYGTLYTSLMVPTGLLLWKAVRTGDGSVEAATLLPYAGVALLASAAYLTARFLKRSGRLVPRSPTLEELRERIDATDAELLRLLNDRAEIVATIFAHKRDTGLARYDPVRAREIVARVRRLNAGPLGDEEVERLFTCLLESISSSLAKPPEAHPPGEEPERSRAEARSCEG